MPVAIFGHFRPGPKCRHAAACGAAAFPPSSSHAAGVRTQLARKLSLPASYEAADLERPAPETVASQPPEKAPAGRNLHRRWYRQLPVDRARTRVPFGVQIMRCGGLWLVQAPCVLHGLGTQSQKGGVVKGKSQK